MEKKLYPGGTKWKFWTFKVFIAHNADNGIAQINPAFWDFYKKLNGNQFTVEAKTLDKAVAAICEEVGVKIKRRARPHVQRDFWYMAVTDIMNNDRRYYDYDVIKKADQ